MVLWAIGVSADHARREPSQCLARWAWSLVQTPSREQSKALSAQACPVQRLPPGAQACPPPIATELLNKSEAEMPVQTAVLRSDSRHFYLMGCGRHHIPFRRAGVIDVAFSTSLYRVCTRSMKFDNERSSPLANSSSTTDSRLLPPNFDQRYIGAIKLTAASQIFLAKSELLPTHFELNRQRFHEQ